MKKVFSVLLMVVTAFVAVANPVAGVALANGAFGAGALNPNSYERGKAFLEWVMAGGGPVQESLMQKIGSDVLAEYRAGKLGLFQSNYYFRKAYSTSDREFIKNTDDLTYGLRNLDKGKIGKNEVLILTDFDIQWAQKLTSDSPLADTVLYSKQIWDLTTQYAAGTVDLDAGATSAQSEVLAVQRIDTKIVNSEYFLSVGPELIHEGKFSDHFVNNLNGVETPAGAYPALRTPKIIKGDTAISFTSKLAEGGSFTGSTSFFMELSFGGVKLRPVNG